MAAQLSLFAYIGSKLRVLPPREEPLPVIEVSIESIVGEEPQLQRIWDSLLEHYFPERADLTDYRVLWSKRRQKRTLAACHIEKRKVVVAKELCHPKWERWLDPLLYHEMCHAVIGEKPEIRNGKRLWHGPQFRALERRHPGIQEFDRWIREGGWLSAVRSARSREYHARKKSRGSCQ